MCTAGKEAHLSVWSPAYSYNWLVLRQGPGCTGKVVLPSNDGLRLLEKASFDACMVHSIQ